MSYKPNEQLTKAITSTLSRDKDLKAMQASMDNLTAIYPYYQDGKEVFAKVRFDKDGKKWIKPFYFDGKCYRLGEPKLKPKPIYQPMPLTDTVYIVEGEKCVHSLIDLGLCAVTTGGANTIGKCDLTPLLGRKCVLSRDNDDSGGQWQDELITALESLTIAFEVIDVAGVQMPDGEPMADKDDCYDFIQAHLADGNDYAGVMAVIESLPRLAIPSDKPTTPSNDDPKAILKQRKAQLQAVIAELAAFDDMELTLSLRAVASEFGIPQKKILEYVTELKQGELIPNTTPYHEPVTGQELYKALYQLIDDFIVIDEPYKVVFVLWVIFTHLLDHTEFAPLAWITAPEKQCGKSTLLGLFARVVDKGKAVNTITPSALQRVVEKYRPCLLIDEIDANLDKNSTIWGVINGGHSKTADGAIKCNQDNGNALEAFSAYGAKVICGIGANLPASTISRTIRFVLRRKTKDDKCTKRFILKNLPYAQTNILKSKVKRWAVDNADKIAGVNIPIFDINDRDYDNWEFLLQIASVLGVYDVAVRACLEICRQEKEPTQNEQLLSDIRDIWHGDKMSSKLLLERLTANDESQWQTLNNGQPITAHQLAKRLKAFGIQSKNMWQGDSVIKGFDKADFVKVWEQYLSPQAEQCNPFFV